MSEFVSELKKYKVSIFGQSYVLYSDEPESRLIAASQLVDNAMRQISQSSKITDSNNIAVLVALQLASKSLMALDELDRQSSFSIKLIDTIERELYQLNSDKL